MDKALFRAYVKELVKEQIEESVEKAVKKILPEILSEAIAEIKGAQGAPINEVTATPSKSKLSRSQLAQMMGLDRVGDTIVATTDKIMPVPPRGIAEDNPAFQAINRDYSAVMKAMGLSK